MPREIARPAIPLEDAVLYMCVTAENIEKSDTLEAARYFTNGLSFLLEMLHPYLTASEIKGFQEKVAEGSKKILRLKALEARRFRWGNQGGKKS